MVSCSSLLSECHTVICSYCQTVTILNLRTHLTHMLLIPSSCDVPPSRSNVRGVFITAVVFAMAQSFIFFLYAGGYVFGAYLVVEGRNSYDDIFR